MTDRLDDHFRFNQLSLGVRAQRQQVLATNIANADTPNYKARDLDFSSQLQAASARFASAASGVAQTHAAHLSTQATAGRAALLYRIARQDSIDGNTVEPDTERALFADNALRYEAGVSAVNGKIKDLLAVLQS